MAVVRLAKLKTCRVCPTQFRPMSSTQVVCSPECAREYVKRREERKAEREKLRAEKAERADRRKRKRELMTVSEWIKVAQAAFNAYIRARDHDMPCISCGVTNPPERYGGAWDCGHFRSVGAAPELRFDERNAYRQCKSCNGGSANFAAKGETVRAEYRRRLIERVGLELVEWLEGPHEPKHYSAAELEELAKDFRARRRELERTRNGAFQA